MCMMDSLILQPSCHLQGIYFSVRSNYEFSLLYGQEVERNFIFINKLVFDKDRKNLLLFFHVYAMALFTHVKIFMFL